jgi:YhcH/YjgK/YiaL family protein
MIYDNIKNIGLYKGISAALDVALDYIAAAKLPLENGTTLLEHGVKAIVSSYVTKEVNPKGYEAHLKYADVQFLMDGSEYIRCCPLEYLEPATEYDEAKDCRFYVEQPGSGCDLRLGAGYFAVVFPDDAHIPQLAAGTPAEVKKIVMKVPVE